GQLVQVIGSGYEPPEESVEPETENLGDPLKPAERRHLPEHPIVVRGRPRGQVPSETARLTQGMLAGRRIKMTGRRGIWHGGAVTEGEDIVESLDAEGFIHLDATALIDRDSPIGDQRIRPYPRPPNPGLGRPRGALGEPAQDPVPLLNE